MIYSSDDVAFSYYFNCTLRRLIGSKIGNIYRPNGCGNRLGRMGVR